MHNEDIGKLLDRCSSEIKNFSEQVKSSEIDKIALKNTLENLRSALDYLAQDILFKLKANPKYKNLSDKIYFPYGQKENHFRNSVQKNLPHLQQFEPKVYDLIEAIQPFKSKNNWLVDLCLLTNSAKHNNLSKTENRKVAVVEQRGVGLFEGVNIDISHNYINGVRQDDVFVDGSGRVSINKHSGTTLVTERNRILFHGKNLEIIPFVTRCLNEIKALSSSVGGTLKK